MRKRFLGITTALLIAFGTIAASPVLPTLLGSPGGADEGTSIPAETQGAAIQTNEASTATVAAAPALQLQSTILLDVPILLQKPDLPTGCEIVSTTMLLQYAGADISAVELAGILPYDDEDPSLGYVGDPYTTDGWTIWPEALIGTVREYLPEAEILTGASLEELQKKIDEGSPVVVWLSWMHGFGIHSVLVTGYDDSGLYYNDPWTGEQNAWISTAEFLDMWADQDYRAISY